MINPISRYKWQDVSKDVPLTPYPLPRTTGSRGFTLLIAVIFMSVMLSFGLALASLGYKQQVLASSAIESQYAFYAADAALECVLYYDQQRNLFATEDFDPSSPTKTMSCDNNPNVSVSQVATPSGDQVISTIRRMTVAGTRCADVTVYKPSSRNDNTYIFSQGYDVPCSTVDNPNGARLVSRGLKTHYGGFPIPGVCGSANGTTVSSAPVTNLCIPESAASAVFGSGPWTWSCSGINEGAPASCSANTSVPSPCALPWGGTIASGRSVTAYQVPSVTPPATCASVSETRRCSNGVLSGSYVNQSCSRPRVDGVCAPTHYNCIAGTSTRNEQDAGGWTWRCRGSGGGRNISCSEQRP